MRLPSATAKYDRSVEANRIQQIEQADAQNLKRGRDVEFRQNRLILTSPNGTRYKVVVDNAGVLSTEAL